MDTPKQQQQPQLLLLHSVLLCYIAEIEVLLTHTSHKIWLMPELASALLTLDKVFALV